MTSVWSPPGKTSPGLWRSLRSSARFRGGAITDPVDGGTLDVYQVMFYQRQPDAAATWRTLVVAPPAQVDRSPCGTGTSALVAHLVARGDADPVQGITARSIAGGVFTATGQPVSDRGGRAGALVPTISGSAYINGFQTVVVDHTDPFRDGFTVGT